MADDFALPAGPAAASRVVKVTAQSAATFADLDGDLAGEFYVDVVGHYTAGSAEQYIAIKPNGVAPSDSECHLHGTYNQSGVAGATPTHGVEARTGGIFVARTYDNHTYRNAIRASVSLQAADPTSQGQRVWTSFFQSRRSAGDNCHLGGEAHGWWAGGGKITSLTVDLGASFTGWVRLRSLTNAGLAV